MIMLEKNDMKALRGTDDIENRIECFAYPDNKVRVSDPLKSESVWNEFKVISTSDVPMKLEYGKEDSSFIRVGFRWGENAFDIAEPNAFQDIRLFVVSDTNAKFNVFKDDNTEYEGYFILTAQNDEEFCGLQFFFYNVKAREPLCCTPICLDYNNVIMEEKQISISKKVWLEKIKDYPIPEIINFYASELAIEKDEKVDLFWQTTNTDYCILNPGEIRVESNGIYEEYDIGNTTEFTLTAVNGDKKTSRNFTVFIKNPVILSYDTEPYFAYGDTCYARMSYETQYCDSVEIISDKGRNVEIDPGHYAKGEVVVLPVSDAKYTLVCKHKNLKVEQELLYAKTFIKEFSYDPQTHVLKWDTNCAASVELKVKYPFCTGVLSKEPRGNMIVHADYVGKIIISAMGIGDMITKEIIL